MVYEDNVKKLYNEPSLQIFNFANDVLTNGSTDVGEQYPSDWE